MALVQVFMSGLEMFSDFGIKTSIIQNERGDDPVFLNTAWTLQVIRGGYLWIAASALAYPASLLYEEPMLLQLLPVSASTAFIRGFRTTKVGTSERHIHLERLTIVNLAGRVVGISITVTLAFLMRSVWALVLGGVIGTVIQVLFGHWFLPGIRNRFAYDKQVAKDIFGFGAFLFFSTVSAFAINQSDRAILGAFISMGDLGVYNIGFFLGTMPHILSKVVSTKVISPLYRMRHPADDPANRRKIFRARRLITGGALAASAVMAYGGVLLVDLLYDARYAMAGPILVLLSFAAVPKIVTEGVAQAALMKGDSRRFFYIFLATAIAQVVMLYYGARELGIFGAVLAFGFAPLVTYPFRAKVVHSYKSWDAKGDLVLMAAGFAVNGVACWLHWDGIVKLMG
jgi:O-antigen/teichoic acid export membrane protein